MNLLKGFLITLFCLVFLLYLFLLPTFIQTDSSLIRIIQTRKCIPHHVNKKLRCYLNEEINVFESSTDVNDYFLARSNEVMAKAVMENQLKTKENRNTELEQVLADKEWDLAQKQAFMKYDSESDSE